MSILMYVMEVGEETRKNNLIDCSLDKEERSDHV